MGRIGLTSASSRLAMSLPWTSPASMYSDSQHRRDASFSPEILGARLLGLPACLACLGAASGSWVLRWRWLWLCGCCCCWGRSWGRCCWGCRRYSKWYLRWCWRACCLCCLCCRYSRWGYLRVAGLLWTVRSPGACAAMCGINASCSFSWDGSVFTSRKPPGMSSVCAWEKIWEEDWYCCVVARLPRDWPTWGCCK